MVFLDLFRVSKHVFGLLSRRLAFRLAPKPRRRRPDTISANKRIAIALARLGSKASDKQFARDICQMSETAVRDSVHMFCRALLDESVFTLA